MTVTEDQIAGALLGCAVGDALGAPFEGLWESSIPESGCLMSGFAEFEGYPRGQYTDDTQLTIATAESIADCGWMDPSDIASRIAQLWTSAAVVGPGGACTRAADHFLRHGDWRTCGAPVGQAGNGTAMRTAILGVCWADRPQQLVKLATDVSRITHQDPRSVAGGVAVAWASSLMAENQAIHPEPFCQSIASAIRALDPDFARLMAKLPSQLTRPSAEALREIASAGMVRPEFDSPIITPFVVPTVLASFWCVLKNAEHWSDAVASAIRLGGDVDTLGAIVGALMGVRLGASAIPNHLRRSVLSSAELRILAARLHAKLRNVREQGAKLQP